MNPKFLLYQDLIFAKKLTFQFLCFLGSINLRTYETAILRVIRSDNPKTGYAKFWAAPEEGDICENVRFSIIPLLLAGPKIRSSVRRRMNDAVDMINQKIQSQIISMDPHRIKFVNIDEHFEGHRFCEKNKTDPIAAIGATDPNVWWISLGTKMEETEWIPANTPVQELPAPNSRGSGSQFGNPFKKLHTNSVFHPKRAAHERTARKIADVVGKFAHENRHTLNLVFGSCPVGQSSKGNCQQVL